MLRLSDRHMIAVHVPESDLVCRHLLWYVLARDKGGWPVYRACERVQEL